MKTFKISTYRTSEDDVLSVYVSTDEEFEINEAIEYLSENYKNHEKCSLIEENEPSVANHLGYKYTVIFHEDL